MGVLAESRLKLLLEAMVLVAVVRSKGELLVDQALARLAQGLLY